jgi:hypothetical protein
MLVFICGNALAGKDTLFKILSSIVEDTVICDRLALADELKCILNPFTKQHFNISAFTKNLDEKKLIRPLMVETADIFRTISQGTYWTGVLQPKVEESIKNGNLPIITDGRFCEYPHDEIWWAKEKNNGRVVFVNRTLKDGTRLGPANYKEAKNEKKLQESADFSVNWPTSDDYQYLSDVVKAQLKGLIKEICQTYQKKLIMN